jgi:hypothetical protein
MASLPATPNGMDLAGRMYTSVPASKLSPCCQGWTSEALHHSANGHASLCIMWSKGLMCTHRCDIGDTAPCIALQQGAGEPPAPLPRP